MQKLSLGAKSLAAIFMALTLLTTSFVACAQARTQTVDHIVFEKYANSNLHKGPVIRKYHEALKLYDNQEMEKSIIVLRQVTKLDPACAGAYYTMGASYLWGDEYQHAADAFSSAVKLEPNNFEFKYRRSLAYISLLKYNEAVADLDAAIKAAPMRGDFYNIRAKCLLAQNKPEAALNDYNMILKMSPHSDQGLLNRANLLLKLNRPQAALADMIVLNKAFPDESDGYAVKGLALMQLKRFPEAIEAFDKAIDMGSDLSITCLAKKKECLSLMGKKK